MDTAIGKPRPPLRVIVGLGLLVATWLLFSGPAHAMTSIDDSAHYIKGRDRAALQEQLTHIDSLGVSTRIVVSPNIKWCNAPSVESCAFNLFDQWGVKEAKLLVLTSMGDRSTHIVVSKEVAPVLARATLESLVADMAPLMRKQQYGAALTGLSSHVYSLLKGSPQTNLEPSLLDVLEAILLVVLVVFALLVLLAWIGGSTGTSTSSSTTYWYDSSSSSSSSSSSGGDSGSTGDGGGGSW